MVVKYYAYALKYMRKATSLKQVWNLMQAILGKKTGYLIYLSIINIFWNTGNLIFHAGECFEIYWHYLPHTTSKRNDIIHILLLNNLRSVYKHVFLTINDDF